VGAVVDPSVEPSVEPVPAGGSLPGVETAGFEPKLSNDTSPL
jgi:hypothetical protein